MTLASEIDFYEYFCEIFYFLFINREKEGYFIFQEIYIYLIKKYLIKKATCLILYSTK